MSCHSQQALAPGTWAWRTLHARPSLVTRMWPQFAMPLSASDGREGSQAFPVSLCDSMHPTPWATCQDISAHPLWAKLKLLRTLMSVSGQMLLLRLFLAAACPPADAAP